MIDIFRQKAKMRKIAILQAEILKIPIQDIAEAFEVDEGTIWSERNRLGITRNTNVSEIKKMIREIESESEAPFDEEFQLAVEKLAGIEKQNKLLREERLALYKKLAKLSKE